MHGGGFYNPQKYQVAPGFMPEKLHWFYWESYSTWLSGFGLLTVENLGQAEARSADDRHNKGGEAAHALLGQVALRRRWGLS